MNKPQAIEHITSHGHTVVLDDPKKLVVKQGFTCIDGGSVKHNGKYVRLMVRYDDKPELAAKIEAWKSNWNEYNAWFEQQIADCTKTIVTNSDKDKAENNDFSWSYWDGTSGKTLRDKSSEREIYQMKYTDNHERVTGEQKEKVSVFWRALERAKKTPITQDQRRAAKKAEAEWEQTQREREAHPGWCNRCHSYCYGDCQAN